VKTSYILTTCCGDLNVAEQHGGGGIYAKTMSERAQLIHDEILPAALKQDPPFDEMLVVGRFPQALVEAYPDVMWLFLPPERLDRIEAFRERECAARWSRGDILVLSADDHKLADDFTAQLRAIREEPWDLITPKRVHALTGQTLNNGLADGYSPWHCQVLRRSLWAQLPFTAYDTLWVDILLPERYKRLGAQMVWSDDLIVYDVEAQEGEE